MTVDPVELAEYLKSQRWFAGKGAPIKSISVLESLAVPRGNRPDVEADVVQVSYLLGQPERYLVLVQRDAEGRLKDALEDPRVALAMLELIREARTRTLGTGTGIVRGTPIGRGAEVLAALPPEPRVRHLGVEQSNTSLVLDERVILKVIRKLETGVNPELEMGRFLATRTDFRATPALLGAIELEGPASAALGLVHAFVPNQGDGWKVVTDVFRSGRGHEAAFLATVEHLGRRIGELHGALGSAREDPDFAPDPILQEDLQRWSASIVGEMGVTLAKAAPRFPELAGRRDSLTEEAKALAAISPSGKKIRQHGDLHLGQVLRTADDWMVIDFEGEPARVFNSRREKHTPLRDVAGMLRSFSYAAAASGLTGEARSDARGRSRAAFLKGYRSAVPAELLPASEEDVRLMLDILELEKTFYELRYELQFRPDWAHIPVEALL